MATSFTFCKGRQAKQHSPPSPLITKPTTRRQSSAVPVAFADLSALLMIVNCEQNIREYKKLESISPWAIVVECLLYYQPGQQPSTPSAECDTHSQSSLELFIHRFVGNSRNAVLLWLIFNLRNCPEASRLRDSGSSRSHATVH